MASSSWEEKLTCKWTDEGQLDITGFPDDMPICLQYYLSSIKSEKWPRAVHLIQEGEGHCFVSGTGISFPPDYESSSSSDEDGPKRGPLPEDEVELCAGRFPKNRVKRLLFLRIVKKCLSERSNETHGPLDGELQFLAYIDEEEKRAKQTTESAETGSPSPMEISSSVVQVTQSENEEMETSASVSLEEPASVGVHTEIASDSNVTFGWSSGPRDESNPIAETKKGPKAPTSYDDIQDLITNNYDLLKDNINVDKVFHHMIHKHVVEPSDKDEILGMYILDSERAEALLDMISRRRSCLPALFLDILNIEHPDVVDKLSTEVSSPKYIISRQKAGEGPFYKMSHSPRGTALIVIDTNARDPCKMKEESELLADAFKSLNFLPKIVKDIDSIDTFHMSNSPNYSRALAKTLMEYGKSDEFVSIMAKVYSVCDNFYCQNGLQKRLHFPP
ncbi:uncharacterized protein [Branchiostoma lanceolatum]|uniref:uncharacterized protein n=1 Tax=Branchiostoma lanceolatum TaxID=7740 RepID=UPI003452011A